ncbi:MAG: hypothetical protein MUP69_10445 [Candidatus Atribacteria bacterium]|nr:hypothetical protein [Candidatus Atribacteria bacterium]
MSNPDKIYETVKRITTYLKAMLDEYPDFTGDIHFSFCLGGLTGIEKTEKIKIK